MILVWGLLPTARRETKEWRQAALGGPGGALGVSAARPPQPGLWGFPSRWGSALPTASSSLLPPLGPRWGQLQPPWPLLFKTLCSERVLLHPGPWPAPWPDPHPAPPAPWPTLAPGPTPACTLALPIPGLSPAPSLLFKSLIHFSEEARSSPASAVASAAAQPG